MPGPTAATNPIAIFDRHALRRHRARAAQRYADSGFLFREGAERLRAAGIDTVVAGEAGPLTVDLEALPFAPASFDLVTSSLAFHWINDLPGTLLQLRHILKPDGLLLVNLFAGET